MTPDERLALIREKTKRANENIQNLYRAIIAFKKTNPYPVAVKRDPQTGEFLYYVVSVPPIPAEISAIAGDVLQNLRSALDHLAYQFFMLGPGGTSGASPKHVYFPISESIDKYKAELNGKVQGMRQDAIDAISAIQPYKGGRGAVLWQIHRLNNIDKHRFLLLAGAAFRSHDLLAEVRDRLTETFGPSSPASRMRMFVGPPTDRKFPLEAGDVIHTEPPNAKTNKEMAFAFEVAFSEAGVIHGKSLIETLEGMAKLVNNLLTDFGPLLY